MISWGDLIFEGKVLSRVPSDQCLFRRDKIILAERMEGILDPEEWAPLLASSLIYWVKFRRRRIHVSIVRLFLPEGLAFAGIVLVAHLLRDPGLVLLALFPFVVVSLVGLISYITAERNLRLQADVDASLVVGRENFLGVLRKIYSLGLDDIKGGMTPGRYRRLSLIPSIIDRINNLESGIAMQRP